METFYHNQKNSYNVRKIGYKITKKQVKNKNSDLSCDDIAVAVFRVQGPSQNIEKLRKLLMLNHGTYQIAADEMTGGWSHDQFTNRIKTETTKS